MGAKYRVVAALSFFDRLSYPSELWTSLVASALRVFVAAVLWRAVFSGRETLGGMTLSMVVSYYVLSSLLGTLDRSDGYTWEFAGEIREGRFGKYLIRPLDPLGHFLAVCLGRTAFHLPALLGAAVLVAAVQAVADISLVPAPSIPGLLLLLPVFTLGISALALLNYLTALLAFAFQDITPFHLIKGNLVQLLSGLLIPPALLPGWGRTVFALTPFPALAALPAELWAGRGLGQAAAALPVLCAWNLGLYAAAKAAPRFLLKRYQEVGA